jgi:hypothetical protein
MKMAMPNFARPFYRYVWNVESLCIFSFVEKSLLAQHEREWDAT